MNCAKASFTIRQVTGGHFQLEQAAVQLPAANLYSSDEQRRLARNASFSLRATSVYYEVTPEQVGKVQTAGSQT